MTKTTYAFSGWENFIFSPEKKNRTPGDIDISDVKAAISKLQLVIKRRKTGTPVTASLIRTLFSTTGKRFEELLESEQAKQLGVVVQTVEIQGRQVTLYGLGSNVLEEMKLWKDSRTEKDQYFSNSSLAKRRRDTRIATGRLDPRYCPGYSP